MFEINCRCIFDDSYLDGRLKRKRDFVCVRNETNKETYDVKYIGETGRSGYERAKEHVRDFLDLKENSHLLRHYILKPTSEMRVDPLEYGMRIRSQFKTALERQIGEAVEKVIGYIRVVQKYQKLDFELALCFPPLHCIHIVIIREKFLSPSTGTTVAGNHQFSIKIERKKWHFFIS